MAANKVAQEEHERVEKLKLRAMKDPKMEPLIIPPEEELEKLSRKRRLKKLLERQAIMYGIDVLDTQASAG